MHGFGSTRGWHPLRRGRHPHASIYGVLDNGFTGVIEAQMEFDSLADWPEELSKSTQFTFFATASLNSAGQRFSLPRGTCSHEVTFEELSLRLDSLLIQAWDIVTSCTREDLTNGPYQLPQLPPE